METRIVEQVKIYKLCMNGVRDRYESTSMVAISTDYNYLVNWYNERRVERYTEESDVEIFGRKLWRSFRKGSELEYYNPVDDLNPDAGRDGRGIFTEWVERSVFDRIVSNGRYNFICTD